MACHCCWHSSLHGVLLWLLVVSLWLIVIVTALLVVVGPNLLTLLSCHHGWLLFAVIALGSGWGCIDVGHSSLLLGLCHLVLVHQVNVGCKGVKTYHIDLPFHGPHLVPSPAPSEHEQNPPTSLNRGEGCLGRSMRLAIDIAAHIPQERGGAEG